MRHGAIRPARDAPIRHNGRPHRKGVRHREQDEVVRRAGVRRPALRTPGRRCGPAPPPSWPTCGAAGPGGTHQNRSERDAFASLHEHRLAQLEAVEDRLAFGRLDLRDGARRYIGRLGLSDDEQTQLLVDWRAPAARDFYQATAASPGDVVRRRHLATRGRSVVGVEDEVLDLDAMDARRSAAR